MKILWVAMRNRWEWKRPEFNKVAKANSMTTFKDLKFETHSIAKSGLDNYKDAKQATETFENGYGVSVLFGSCFYSNGKDTYEVAVLFDGGITYNTDITDDVMGHLSEDEVSEVMSKVAVLK